MINPRPTGTTIKTAASNKVTLTGSTLGAFCAIYLIIGIVAMGVTGLNYDFEWGTDKQMALILLILSFLIFILAVTGIIFLIQKNIRVAKILLLIKSIVFICLLILGGLLY